MATKIELTISPDYVPNWTIVDAIRELFQNAIDQQAQFPNNKMSWNYDKDSNILTIANESSELSMQSLLLGSTTKADNKDTIGQFGEGYKIATLVLLREGKTITFYNYKAHEIWKPRLVDSRRFGTKILTFFIERQPVWKWATINDLTIEIDGITNDEWYSDIAPSNLYITEADVLETTEYGDILADAQGMVYVNGLFVCKYEPYKYGYNFKPQYIKLDRDRKMASDFDLKWLASRMWSTAKDKDSVADLIENNAVDVEFLSNTGGHGMADILYTRFLVKYGSKAIPVSTQSEADSLPREYRGIIVSPQFKSIVSMASGYNEPSIDIIDPRDELDIWFNGIAHKLDNEDVDEFRSIFDRLARL